MLNFQSPSEPVSQETSKNHIKSEIFSIAKQCINAGNDETLTYLNKILDIESKLLKDDIWYLILYNFITSFYR